MIPLRALLFTLPFVAAIGCQKEEVAVQAQQAEKPPVATSEDVEIKRDINYAMSAGPERAYDLYLPKKGDANRPLLIFIHGGAWQSGDKKDYEGLGKAFAGAGIAVAVVNYQLSPKVQHPKHIEDIAFAYGHLANNVYGFDPKRIIVMGHSAGAHMCGLLAADPDMLMRVGTNKVHYPKGMIGLEGIYDIPNLVKVWPSYRNWFIEKAFGKDDKWAAASPTRLPIKLKSKWLLVHASGDELVDAKQTDDFKNQLFIRNVKIDLDKTGPEVYDPGKLTHDQVVRDLGTSGSEVFKKVVAFIEANSKPEAAQPQ